MNRGRKKEKKYPIKDSSSKSLKVAERASHYLLSAEFLTAAETDMDTLMALENFLKRAHGFALAFVRINMPIERERLVTQIRQRLESVGKKIIEINLSTDTVDLLADILKMLKSQHFFFRESGYSDRLRTDGQRQPLIFVFGVERLILSSETFHPSLSVLNYKRELFRERIPVPIVFWLPEYALQAIVEGAPDFWAWRSGVFEFISPRPETEKRWLEEQPRGDDIALSNLTRKEKMDRIESLSGLLSEYEALEHKDAENIVLVRLGLLDRISRLYYLTGDYDRALKLQTKALAIANQFNLQPEIGQFLHLSAIIHQDRGGYEEAIKRYSQALEIAEKLGDPGGVSRAFHQMASVYYLRGKYIQALQIYSKSLRILENLGDLSGVGRSYHQIGIVYQAQGDDDKALDLYKKSLHIFEKLGDLSGVSNAYQAMGMVYQDRGDYDRALELYEKSLVIANKIGDLNQVSRSYHQMGVIYQIRGDYDRSLDLFNQSKAIAEKLGDMNSVAISNGQIGKLFMDLNKFTESIPYLVSAQEIMERIGSPNAQIVADWLKQVGGQID